MCALAAPEAFWIDDNGYTQYIANPDDTARDNVMRAVQDCPAVAIRVLREDRP